MVIEEEGADEGVETDRDLTLPDILQAQDLTPMLTDSQLSAIGAKVIRDVRIDEESRQDWKKRYTRALDVAMQVRKPKSFPWANASNIKYPILTTAAVQFQARAYPAIVNDSNLVKGRVLGPDPDGTKRDRADRIGAHMTWQLLYRMPDWEEETDKLLLMLPIVGCVFRKSYHDPIDGGNASDLVPATDFIVNYWAKSLKTAPRYTHVLHYHPHEAQERISAGLWRNIRINPESNDDEEAKIDFYEQHTRIDLDGDGYPEPYVVTTNTEGEVARIVACFGPEDITVRANDTGKPEKLVMLAEQNRLGMIGDVVRIERRAYFTKYGFIPAVDGSFYDMGFGTLLDDISIAIDTAINQLFDAGTLQNAQGGFIGSGVNIKGGAFSFRVGEWKRVDTTGGTLRDNILPLQLPGPASTLFQLLGMLVEAAKDITSVQNVMTGEGTANQPATTTLALIEQGQKVMTAIFKRIHRAFAAELRILRALNRDFLDREEYFQLNDNKEAQQVSQHDYNDNDLDVVPVSDPTAVSDMQKMARAQTLMVFNGDPLINQNELRRRYLEAVGANDIKALLTPDEKASQPDPKILIEGGKLALAKLTADADAKSKRGAAAKALSDAATTLAALGLVDDASALAAAATEIGAGHEENVEPAGEPGSDGALADVPGDAGVPAVPRGPSRSPDGAMGFGGTDDAGIPSGGGDVSSAYGAGGVGRGGSV